MFELIFFGIFLLVMIVLDIALLVSLIRPGDERRQIIVWKSSTWALIGTTGGLMIGIVKSIILGHAMNVNPLVTITTAAIIYFICFLFYKKKYGA